VTLSRSQSSANSDTFHDDRKNLGALLIDLFDFYGSFVSLFIHLAMVIDQLFVGCCGKCVGRRFDAQTTGVAWSRARNGGYISIRFLNFVF
jgi:hypothetical protein